MPGVTVDYKEIARAAKSPKISVNGDGQTTTRVFLVAWDDVKAFIWQVLGYSYITGTGGSTRLRRYLPLMDPVFTWLPATEIVDIEPVAHTGGKVTISPGSPVQSLNVFKQAFVTVRFSEVDYFIDTDENVDANTTDGETIRCVSFKSEASVDFLSQPGAYLYWTEGSAPYNGQIIADAPSKPIVGRTFVYKWLQVPYSGEPTTAITAALGTMNTTAIFGCDPWTLFFSATERELIKMPFGTWGVNLTYIMRYLPTRWDRIPNVKLNPIEFNQIAYGKPPGSPAVFHTPGVVADGKLLFNATDHHKLFQPEPA